MKRFTEPIRSKTLILTAFTSESLNYSLNRFKNATTVCCLETLGFTVALFGSIYIGRVKDKATKCIVQKASYLLSSSVLNYYIKETSHLQLCHCSL